MFFRVAASGALQACLFNSGAGRKLTAFNRSNQWQQPQLNGKTQLNNRSRLDFISN
ncbi:hypothetical protein EMIT047CA2_180035 [Pseudomonas soli]